MQICYNLSVSAAPRQLPFQGSLFCPLYKGAYFPAVVPRRGFLVAGESAEPGWYHLF